MCIFTGENFLLSAANLLGCCRESNCSSFGCDGGNPTAAWQYFSETGLVSGGLYGDETSCQPYPFPPCAHHVTTSQYHGCPDADYLSPECLVSCSSPSFGGSYSADIKKSKNAYAVQGEREIQLDIMTHGPVTASFQVYSDFYGYSRGVYQHAGGEYVGAHSVRLVGWGVDRGLPYWIAANSWNPTWGDGGFFKILRGEDHLGIESDVAAGLIG